MYKNDNVRFVVVKCSTPLSLYYPGTKIRISMGSLSQECHLSIILNHKQKLLYLDCTSSSSPHDHNSNHAGLMRTEFVMISSL